MNKIKKFRVSPRPASVLKNLKALAGVTRSTPELEGAVETESRRVADLYATAALYETYKLGETPASLASLWEKPADAPGTPVALTLYAATIGAPIEEELAAALTRGEALMSQVLTAVGEESADQAAGFVLRMTEEEAVKEGCDLSPRRDVSEGGARREILTLLGADRLGMAVDAAGRLSPRFTRVGALLWYPPKKRK